MHSGTPPSVFSGRGGRCGAKDGVPLPETNGCSCISGCGASPNPGGRRSAPSGRPAASPVTARGSAREPKVLAMRWGMEANMTASVEGWKPSAFRVSSRERHWIRKRLVTYADHVRKFVARPWRGGKASDHVGEDLEELNTTVFQIEPQNLKELAQYQNALRLLTVIADNRGEPIDSANGSVPLLLWFVLIVGGIITRYPIFRGASNRLA